MRGLIARALAASALFAVPAAQQADARPASGNAQLSVGICVGDVPTRDTCGPQISGRVAGKTVLDVHLNVWPPIAKAAGTVVGPQINCPRVCSSAVTAGKAVTITAKPNTNPSYNGSYQFDHWAGSASTCTPKVATCTITVGKIARLVAVFVSK